MKVFYAKVISGEHKGKIGIADALQSEKTGEIIFYPKDGGFPYWYKLKVSEIESIDF